MFEVWQFNTDSYDESIAENVLRKAAASFVPHESEVPTLLQRELYNFRVTPFPVQHFYLVDVDANEIAASMGFVIRQSTLSGKKNIVVSMVNTTQEYRKLGLMNSLINFTLSLYEDRREVIDTRFRVPETVLEESATFINTHVTPGSFYTLYSAVGEYYKRNGFTSVPMTLFSTSAKLLLDLDHTDQFPLHNGEEYLTLDNSRLYLVDDKYIPHDRALLDGDARCCSFKCPSIERFYSGNMIYFRSRGVEVKHQGLVIKTDGFTTVLALSNNFNPELICLRRLFTDVPDRDVLQRHLERIHQYIGWYVSEYNIDIENSKVLLAEGDIISNKREFILGFFQARGWALVENSGVNPMIREWNSETTKTVWNYNGFWCYS